MAQDDVYLLSLRQRLNNQLLVNVFAVRCKDAIDPLQADFANIADYLKERLRTRQAQNLSHESWRAVQARGAGTTYSTTKPFRSTLVAFEAAHTGVLTGALLTDCNALQIAAVVRWRTDQAGRRRRGRSYVGGIADAQYATGTLIAGAVTAMQTEMNAIVTTYGALGTNTRYELGVWSDRTATKAKYDPVTRKMVWDGTAQDPANAYRAIQSAQVQSILYTQRRRVIGTGA